MTNAAIHGSNHAQYSQQAATAHSFVWRNKLPGFATAVSGATGNPDWPFILRTFTKAKTLQEGSLTMHIAASWVSCSLARLVTPL